MILFVLFCFPVKNEETMQYTTNFLIEDELKNFFCDRFANLVLFVVFG